MYDELEREMVTNLESGQEVAVFNAAALTNKLLQFANGAVYKLPGSPEYHEVHDLKLDALESIIEETGDNSILLAYSYKSDQERIMKKFPFAKSLTLAKGKAAIEMINDWNQGKIKLMVGHPACLHPSTKLLTEFRGWVSLINVTKADRVFDGIEFVSHGGCVYSGHKEVTSLFGLTLTLNHKMLIDNVWTEAGHVRNCRDSKRKALYKYQGDDKYLSQMLKVRSGIQSSKAECKQTQSQWLNVLSSLCTRLVPPHDKLPDMADMARTEGPGQGYRRQGLRGARDKCVSRVGRLQSFLRGHAPGIQRPVNYRTGGRESGILEGELCLDYSVRSTGQQADHSTADVSGGVYPFSGIMQENKPESRGVIPPVKSRDDCRPGGPRRFEVNIQKEPKKADVYDLINCGPRCRFLIRNDKGEVFISHNSMGHGLNLQQGGHTLVFFGIPWALDLYDQFIGRELRQGQTMPVICHRIMMQNTIEDVVRESLDAKATTQSDLRSAIQHYARNKKGIFT